jgi:predicted MFS family arabinose efflux permease
LAGIAGASVAPLAGRFADRRDARVIVTTALAGAAMSLVWMGGAPRAVWAIVLGIILLDLSTQAGQISNQSRIYALKAHARGRVNTVYMVTYFIGGALGSGAASLAFGLAGWDGVMVAGLCFLAAGGAAHGWGYVRTRPHRRKVWDADRVN